MGTYSYRATSPRLSRTVALEVSLNIFRLASVLDCTLLSYGVALFLSMRLYENDKLI